MLPPGLTSAREVQLYYDKVYFDLITSGQAHPFLYPWATAGALFIILYLLIDHRKSELWSSSRYVAFALVAAFQAWCLLTNKARNPAAAFGVGLICSFGTLWVATHVIVNDCQTEYRRIERSSKNPQQLYWQPYPDGLAERLDWIVDVFFSFRGVGWNWQTNGVPAAPKWVEDSLKGEPAQEKVEAQIRSKTGIRRISDLTQLLWDVVPKALIGYIALDALKTTLMCDSYFWGYIEAPAPAFYPDLIRSSYFLLKSCRLLLTLASVVTALGTIYKLGPIFFAGILGPRLIGLRGEAWMNPADYFGSFSNVLDKGLAGLWGGWWHQTFRFAFEAPGTKLLAALAIDKKSKAGKTLSLFVAFFLSGILHACGSYTQLGETRPLRGPMSFFLLQAVGILIEELKNDAIKASGSQLPKPVTRCINLAFATFWLYHTAPLLADDFSRGGVWLFEPVPISIFRGLGVGPKDAGWWCWGDLASWHTGKSWWDTGIAL